MAIVLALLMIIAVGIMAGWAIVASSECRSRSTGCTLLECLFDRWQCLDVGQCGGVV